MSEPKYIVVWVVYNKSYIFGISHLQKPRGLWSIITDPPPNRDFGLNPALWLCFRISYPRFTRRFFSAHKSRPESIINHTFQPNYACKSMFCRLCYLLPDMKYHMVTLLSTVLTRLFKQAQLKSPPSKVRAWCSVSLYSRASSIFTMATTAAVHMFSNRCYYQPYRD